MANENWRNATPDQEKAVQKRQAAEIARLPISEQAKILKSDAVVLAETLEFGRQVRGLLNRFRNADAIPETDLIEVVRSSDYPPGMALALARVFEQQQ